MNSLFREKIRKQIADNALQAALDANAKRRVQGRINAFASLPDWKERRQRAHAVRAEVIGHLDKYLDKFIAKVTENGIIVHRARNAAEANRIVLRKSRRIYHKEHKVPQRNPSYIFVIFVVKRF